MKCKEEWWNLFVFLSEQHISSGLTCRGNCEALCCSKNSLASKRIGSFVIFLPYEYEFIESKSSINFDNLNMFWNEIKNGNTIIHIPWTRNCPFEKLYECSIYTYRPVDCKMFPILVNPSEMGPIFDIDEKCPQYQILDQKFISFWKDAWLETYAHVPNDWWKLLHHIECKWL